MNPATHDEMLDLVAVYALGSLGAEEARIVSAHLAVCKECREEYNALRPAANAVGISAEAAALDPAVSARMKARLLDTVASGPVPIRRPRPMAAFIAAALAAAIILGFYSVQETRRFEQATIEYRQNEQIVAQLHADGARSFAVSHGEILKAGNRIYIVMRSIPIPPQGQVYQAWTLAPGSKTVKPSLTFLPDARGFAIVSLPLDARNIAAVAVSLEPPGGSEQPTTKPIFVRTLT